MTLKKRARAYFNRWIGLAERSKEPYKTHVPILLHLAQSLKVRRVAEFGMGHFSTSIFLDRALFPSLERLTSYEDDPEWFSLISQKHASDSRFEPHLVSKPMWKAALEFRAADYDLVLVDDSQLVRNRVKTLLALRLAKGITKGPAVVVHDVEEPRYRATTFLFPRRTYFRDLSPQTGVLCWKPRIKLEVDPNSVLPR